MHTFLRTAALSAVAAASLFAIQPAKADHDHDNRRNYDRIDRLARSIQIESQTLYHELRSGASHDHELRIARNEVADVYRLASRIHDTAHRYGSPRQLDRDMHALQQLVHHVDEHLHGFRHFRRHVERMDSLAHQLEDRIHDLDARGFDRGRSVPASSGGITFGGRGFSIQLGR
ncbi:MAG: hypothetical protein WD872_07730 [Pirellulaceae bacterium]